MPWPNVYKGRPIRGWGGIRSRVLARDRYECQIRDPLVCVRRADSVDHIGDRDDHAESNLRSACTPCHNRRTSQQGAAARARKRAMGYRPAERHPGSTR